MRRRTPAGASRPWGAANGWRPRGTCASWPRRGTRSRGPPATGCCTSGSAGSTSPAVRSGSRADPRSSPTGALDLVEAAERLRALLLVVDDRRGVALDVLRLVDLL